MKTTKTLNSLDQLGEVLMGTPPPAEVPTLDGVDFSSKGIRKYTVTITPEYAKFVLDYQNTHNRPLKEFVIAEVSRALTNGKWKRNGDTIRFSKTSVLLDGQNRLSACVRTGIPFLTDMIVGLDDEVFDTIDTGASRSSGDILAIAGIPNGKSTAATVRWIRAIKGNMIASAQGGSTILSPEEVLSWVRENPGVSEMVSHVLHTPGLYNLGWNSIVSGLLFIFKERNDLLYRTFSKKLETGANLEEHDPVLLLRNKLIDLRYKSRVGKTTIDTREVASYIIHAWNAHIKNNRELKALRGSTTVNGERKYPRVDS